jgi:CheY-like chemotaxis protein
MVNELNELDTQKQHLFTSPTGDDAQKLTRIREVLIVDDEEPFLLTIADGLSIYKNNFSLLTATNGAEAIKILKASSLIDLVVTDLSMPKIDGFELLAYMNRNYPKIPVILMTAFGTPKIEEIVHNMGIFRYLEKPLDIDVLAENIFAGLGIKAVNSEPQRTKIELPAEPSQRTAAMPEQAAFTVEPTSTPLHTKTKVEEKKQSILAPSSVLPRIEEEMKSKSLATFGSRTGISVADLQKMREEARLKAKAKTKAEIEKKVLEEAERKEKLEIKTKTEAGKKA